MGPRILVDTNILLDYLLCREPRSSVIPCIEPEEFCKMFRK